MQQKLWNEPKFDIGFWKDIEKLNKGGIDMLTSTVDGVTGETEICNLWHYHYKSLLNSNQDVTHMSLIEKSNQICVKVQFQ